VLVEHWSEVDASGVVGPSDTEGVAVGEPQDADEFDPRLHPTRIVGRNPISDRTVLGRLRIIPEYAAVRTERYLYVDYASGERELYNVRRDPDEIHNLAGTRPEIERRLAHRLHALRKCQSVSCRRAENRPVP
jgi:hypothetical protein